MLYFIMIMEFFLYVYRFVSCNALSFSRVCHSLEGSTVDEQCLVG